MKRLGVSIFEQGTMSYYERVGRVLAILGNAEGPQTTRCAGLGALHLTILGSGVTLEDKLEEVIQWLQQPTPYP